MGGTKRQADLNDRPILGEEAMIEDPMLASMNEEEPMAISPDTDEFLDPEASLGLF